MRKDVLKKRLSCCFVLFFFTLSGQAEEVLILLKPDTSITIQARRGHPKEIKTFLIARARQSTEAVFEKLRKDSSLQKQVVFKQAHWINASISASVTTRGLAVLKTWSEIEKIIPAFEIVSPTSKISTDDERLYTTAPPYSFSQTKLDRLLAERPELNGKGIFLGSIDTGVDGRHPALKDKISRFYNAKTKKEVPAFDSSGHGTHTVGIMLGGSREGPIYGIAPGAKVIASAATFNLQTLLDSLEWILETHPRAINNSWSVKKGVDSPEPLYRAIEALDAAGILMVFSAGNEGPNDHTITIPHEHPLTLVVGALDAKSEIWARSSRGPAQYQNSETKKPDLAAAGEDVYSAFPFGRYGVMSGTSMAAPLVTGAVALALEVEPSFTPAQLRKLFILTSAQHTSSQNGIWNKDFGFGMLDIYSAVMEAVKFKTASEGRPSLFSNQSLFMNEPADQITRALTADEKPLHFE